MDYFKSFSIKDVVKLISSTKKELFLCMPSIHPEIEVALGELDFKRSFEVGNLDIHLLIDFDSQTFRQGYGDFNSVKDLWKGEFDIKSLPNNRISFIISDEVGYFLFLESRSMIPADKATINAVRIDPVSQVRLKKYFFSAGNQKAFEDELTNAIIEESILLNQAKVLVNQNTAPVSEITEEEVNNVSKDLLSNPPLNPDYKRIVEFYSNKFQYVKLKFEGANLQHRKIELPAKALPISDTALKERLETKLNLFDKKDYEVVFAPLQNFKNEIEGLREKHLNKVKSRDESLLNKIQKQNFEAELTTLKNKIPGLQKELLTDISNLILKTEQNLLKELTDFLKENPRALFPDHPNLWENNSDYVQSTAVKKAQEIIYRIKWPAAHLLVSELKLEAQYSDITFEDLKNRDFIDELIAGGLIDSDDENQLAEFSKGIETRKK